MNTLFSIAMLALSALPPHPLNQSIGGRDGNQKPRNLETVRGNILDSRAYDLMVKLAVASAQDPRMAEDFEMKNLNFGQRARIILARLFEDVNYMKEWRPSSERGFGASDDPAAHPLDTVFRKEPRSDAAVLKSLRESRTFANMIYQAARESQPLRRGLAGLNYAESVRVEIARLMQRSG